MNYNVLILFFLTIGFQNLRAQDGQLPFLLKENNVKSIEAYFFLPDQPEDSLLITIEKFNKAGRRTKIEIYDSLGYKEQYAYDYAFDTIKVQRRYYLGSDLKFYTEIENDINGNEIRTIDFDAKGTKTGWKSSKWYDKNQREIESKICIRRKVISHEKRQYYKNGELKEIKIIKPKNLKETIKFDEFGNRLLSENSQNYMKCEVFENYDSRGIRMVRTKTKRKYKSSTIGIKGWIELQSNDELLTEAYYKSNGLIDYEIQKLNSKLIGTKKYKYLLFN